MTRYYGFITQDTYDAKSLKYNWTDATAYCADLNLSGLTQWRLPSVAELEQMKARRDGLEYFQGAPYWTFEEHADYAGYYLTVNLNTGSTGAGQVDAQNYFRCVHDDSSVAYPGVAANDALVVDNEKALVLQNNDETATTVTDWQGAVNYCADLVLAALGDWVLPSSEEITAKASNYDASLGSLYWTSTELDAPNTDYAKAYGYGSQSFYNKLKTESHLVHCVLPLPKWVSISGMMIDDRPEVLTNRLLAAEAVSYCDAMSFAGYDDWYLPNLEEARLIQNNFQVLNNPGTSNFWTSTLDRSNNAYFVNMDLGTATADTEGYSWSTRCVRNGTQVNSGSSSSSSSSSAGALPDLSGVTSVQVNNGMTYDGCKQYATTYGLVENDTWYFFDSAKTCEDFNVVYGYDSVTGAICDDAPLYTTGTGSCVIVSQ